VLGAAGLATTVVATVVVALAAITGTFAATFASTSVGTPAGTFAGTFAATFAAAFAGPALAAADAGAATTVAAPPDADSIRSRAERNLSRHVDAVPLRAWRDACPAEEAAAIDFLFAWLPPPDLAAWRAEAVIEDVRLALETRRASPWRAQIPEEVFRRWVLPHRVAQEPPQPWRQKLHGMLAPRVRGLSLRDAILETNRFCREQATFIPTSARDQGPLTTMRRGLGRCEEETILFISAARSVGIPARPAWTPWWMSGDNNHAWVEAWDGERWRYLGACEPAAALDEAWFTEPARRAGLVLSGAYGEGPVAGEELYSAAAGVTLLNSTGVYTTPGRLSVEWADAAPGADTARASERVFVHVFNSGSLAVLAEFAAGASILLGPGDYVVTAAPEGRAAGAFVRVEPGAPAVARLDPRGGEEGLRELLAAPFRLRIPQPPPREPARIPQAASGDAAGAAEVAAAAAVKALEDSLRAVGRERARADSIRLDGHERALRSLDPARAGDVLETVRQVPTCAEDWLQFIRRASETERATAIDLVLEMDDKDLLEADTTSARAWCREARGLLAWRPILADRAEAGEAGAGGDGSGGNGRSGGNRNGNGSGGSSGSGGSGGNDNGTGSSGSGSSGGNRSGNEDHAGPAGLADSLWRRFVLSPRIDRQPYDPALVSLPRFEESGRPLAAREIHARFAARVRKAEGTRLGHLATPAETWASGWATPAAARIALTGLFRRNGLPARVEPGRRWVEAWDGGRWIPCDPLDAGSWDRREEEVARAFAPPARLRVAFFEDDSLLAEPEAGRHFLLARFRGGHFEPDYEADYALRDGKLDLPVEPGAWWLFAGARDADGSPRIATRAFEASSDEEIEFSVDLGARALAGAREAAAATAESAPVTAVAGAAANGTEPAVAAEGGAAAAAGLGGGDAGCAPAPWWREHLRSLAGRHAGGGSPLLVFAYETGMETSIRTEAALRDGLLAADASTGREALRLELQRAGLRVLAVDAGHPPGAPAGEPGSAPPFATLPLLTASTGGGEWPAAPWPELPFLLLLDGDGRPALCLSGLRLDAADAIRRALR